ncbi:MAG: hypothetical protein PUB13_07840 [Lachnospiraceae bacterium]|nr:hypothetical protein [Lachnospiraceae bacterium]
MKTIDSQKKDNCIGFFFIVSAISLFIFFVTQCFSNDIWYDEVYSMVMSSCSYREIVEITAKDVHPPFYYFYLKTIEKIALFFMPAFSKVIIAKIATLLPYIGIGIYSMTLVRKHFGIKSAGMFLLFIMAMPQLPFYALEIRMYSLALFLITAAFLHAYEIICGNSRKHFIPVFIYGILTAYTQYFACIAIVGVYLALLLYGIRNRRQNNYLRTWGICVGLSVVSYLPWLPILKEQMSAVAGGYWIEPMSIRSIFGCLKFIFLPVSYDFIIDYILAVCMILICAGVFLYYLRKDHTDKWHFFAFSAIGIPTLIIVVSFVFSIAGHPIFVYRYLVPALGIVWLFIAVLLTREGKRWQILLWIPFLLAGYFNLKGFYVEENKKIEQMELTQEALTELPKDAVIVANFDHVQAVTAYYLEQDVYLYGNETLPLVEKILPNTKSVPDGKELAKLLQTKDVYFFGSFTAREELLQEWEEYGIASEERGSYLLERYWFNLYHLEEK